MQNIQNTSAENVIVSRNQVHGGIPIWLNCKKGLTAIYLIKTKLIKTS